MVKCDNESFLSKILILSNYFQHDVNSLKIVIFNNYSRFFFLEYP